MCVRLCACTSLRVYARIGVHVCVYVCVRAAQGPPAPLRCDFVMGRGGLSRLEGCTRLGMGTQSWLDPVPATGPHLLHALSALSHRKR